MGITPYPAGRGPGAGNGGKAAGRAPSGQGQAEGEGFAAGELEARRASFMVPFSAQALIVAEGKEISSVLAFLQKLKALAEKIKSPSIRIFEPVPLTVQKVMDIERGQLLIEADSKVEMQKFLNRFQPEALSLKAKGSWYIDVDPLNY